MDLLLIQTDTVYSFHYDWIKNLRWVLERFTVLQGSFLEKSQDAAMKNCSEIKNKVKEIIFQRAIKLNTAQSTEICDRVFDLHFDNVQQSKE